MHKKLLFETSKNTNRMNPDEYRRRNFESCLNAARILRYEERIEQPNSKATNQPTSQSTYQPPIQCRYNNKPPRLSVFLYFPLGFSPHSGNRGQVQLSIYIYIYTRDDGSITRLARLVFILYPGCHPARHLPLLPFPLAGRVHLDFHEFRSRKHGGRQHHRRRHPSRAVSRASQPSFSRPFSTPSTPSIRSFSRNCSSYANVVLAQQDSSSSESESRWNVMFNFCRFNFFSPFFFFLRRDFNKF